MKYKSYMITDVTLYHQGRNRRMGLSRAQHAARSSLLHLNTTALQQPHDQMLAPASIGYQTNKIHIMCKAVIQTAQSSSIGNQPRFPPACPTTATDYPARLTNVKMSSQSIRPAPKGLCMKSQSKSQKVQTKSRLDRS